MTTAERIIADYEQYMTGEESLRVPVYFAGPIDYVEHRSPQRHLTDNWRHRFFGDINAIEVLCPICLNEANEGWLAVMSTNRAALDRAHYLIGFFSDQPSFGTPIEINEWVERAYDSGMGDTACLVHPASPGVFVYAMMAKGLRVVKDFEEARQWLRRQLSERSQR